jgi:putative FmdB family regulatory protein
MPLYAFRCQDCAHEFETLARFEETPACPACGAAHVERQLSLIARPAPGGDAGAGESCAAMSGGTPCAGCPALAG